MSRYIAPMCWAIALDPPSKFTQRWAEQLGFDGTYDCVQATWTGHLKNKETLKKLELIILLAATFNTPEWEYIQGWDDDEKIQAERRAVK